MLTLFAANETICAADPLHGRDRQYTPLDVAPFLSRATFRKRVLALVDDPYIHRWGKYLDLHNRCFQNEIVDPIIAQIQRYVETSSARTILGRSQSTIATATLLQDGKIVIINTAKAKVGEDMAALLGETLVYLLEKTRFGLGHS